MAMININSYSQFLINQTIISFKVFTTFNRSTRNHQLQLRNRYQSDNQMKEYAISIIQVNAFSIT